MPINISSHRLAFDREATSLCAYRGQVLKSTQIWHTDMARNSDVRSNKMAGSDGSKQCRCSWKCVKWKSGRFGQILSPGSPWMLAHIQHLPQASACLILSRLEQCRLCLLLCIVKACCLLQVFECSCNLHNVALAVEAVSVGRRDA